MGMSMLWSVKKSFDIRVKNGKIQKNSHGTRGTNQSDLKRNIIMIGLLPFLPKWIFFLLGQSSKTGHDNAPLSLSVSRSATKEVYTQHPKWTGITLNTIHGNSGPENSHALRISKKKEISKAQWRHNPGASRPLSFSLFLNHYSETR